MRQRRFTALAAFVLAWFGFARAAHAQTPVAEMRLGDRPYADVPFRIDLIAEGFDETPAPVQPRLEIAGAVVTPAGVHPSSSRSIQIVNGRRIDSVRVTWVMQWQVVIAKPGRVRVPAVTVTQGSKQATAASGEIEVLAVPTADDMKLALELPERAVFVGETVPMKLVWLFRRQPENPRFTVPMMSLDTFTVGAPGAGSSRNLIEIQAGAKTLRMPYVLDRATVGGAEYNRLTVTFFAAPRKAGKVDVPASSVFVELPVGRPDFFGNAPTRLFRAADTPRTLDVQALPETGKPPTFAGAVGEQFSIEVRTSRSVVQLGEPVELDITVKSNQRLDALALGKLDGEDRLPRDKFTVADEPPTGELSDDGLTKKFKVVAQVTGPATEVPAIAFSYFDPAKRTYQTIHSEPIALSVKGSSIVGAGDVVAATPGKQSNAAPAFDDSVLVNADLALSNRAHTEDGPLGGGVLWALVALLYAVPLAMFAVRSWQVRTAAHREEAAEVRAARRRVEELLDRASTAPAREIAGALASALRDLARVVGRSSDDSAVLAKLETESFAPEAAGRPLSADVRSDAAGLVRRWSSDARRTRGAKSAAATLLLLVLVAPDARADTPLETGRTAYQQAMELAGNPTARKTAFARAATALGEAVRAQPDRPELLADWGNAALGAGDIATATLAYRRALAIDGSNTRARHNLEWLRSRQSDAFRPIATGDATDALLFFHRWPRAQRMLVGAIAFAIAVLLVIPWSTRSGGRRHKTLGALAVLPFAIWLAMLVSVLAEDRRTDDAIVMDAVVMRAADSAGAPAALTQPLPRGAEVTILEQRAAWIRIRIANGTAGWVPSGAIERVRPRAG